MEIFKVNDVVMLRHKNLYWIQQGSHTLNSVIDSTSAQAEDILRARVLKIEIVPNWRNILFLAVEGHVPAEDTALVSLCRNCEKVY